MDNIKELVSIRNIEEHSRGAIYFDIPKLDIPKGFCVALIGENGAGKSTLIKMLTGIRIPQRGSITYNLEDTKMDNIKNEISYVSSDNYFLEKWTIKSFGDANTLMYDSFSMDKFIKLCSDFGIEDMNKKINELSDGMKMKISLAAAFARDTKILILDEPASSLDPLTRETLCSMMSAYIADGEGERSIIFSTHNIPDTADITDYSIIMEGGQVIERGFSEELLDKYVLVSGGKSAAIKAEHHLIGFEENNTGFTGICPLDSLSNLSGLDIISERPTLTQLSIAIIKDAKSPLQSLIIRRLKND